MHGLRTTIGIAMVLALSCWGLGTANASAEQKAFACQSGAGAKDFSDSHCTTKVTAGKGTFGHASILGTTGITATGGGVTWKLKWVMLGLVVEVQCGSLSGSGEIKNETSYASGSLALSASKCSVTQPAGGGCVVHAGEVNLGTVLLTTKGQSANSVKFMPWIGEQFGQVEIESCANSSINAKFPLKGWFVASASGGTLTTTHTAITTQGGLTLGSQKGGLESSMTIKPTSGGVVAFT